MEEKKYKPTIELFLGLKKVMNKEGKDYYTISQDKTKFELFDENKKNQNQEAISLNLDYSFEQNPYENCIMYENICRNAVIDLLYRGKRHFYLTFGLAKTGKKTIIFGEENSSLNKNSRGLLFRLVEDLLIKINTEENSKYTLRYNFYCLHQNKILDITKLKPRDFENIGELELLKLFENVQPSKNYEEEFNKIPIFTIDDFIASVMKTLNMFYRLEPFDNKIYSRSSLILNIHITKENENQPVTKTNVCFCSMASSDTKSEAQVLNINKIRHTINTNTDMANLIQIFNEMKKGGFEVSKFFRSLSINSFLASVLRNNFVYNTTFRIIGCIFPAPYYYLKVKDTVMTLKRLGSNSNENIQVEALQEQQGDNKDTIIYNLSKKIKETENEIDKKRTRIDQIIEENKLKEEKNKENLEVIKREFGFEGDIIKLISEQKDGVMTKEHKFARKIRECMTHNSILLNKIKELEETIELLKKEKEKILIEKSVLQSDITMVNMYSKIKESNLFEENKMKLLLEHNKEKDSLKKQNENLKKKVDVLFKQLEAQTNQYKNLPDILKENIHSKDSNGQIKKEVKIKFELKYKEEIEKLKKSHQQEIQSIKDEYDIRIDDLRKTIQSLQTDIHNSKSFNEKRIFPLQSELIKLNDIIIKIEKQYKKTFDLKSLNLNLVPVGLFIHIKETFDQELAEDLLYINKANFPNLFSINKQGIFKDLKAESSKMQCIKKEDTKDNILIKESNDSITRQEIIKLYKETTGKFIISPEAVIDLEKETLAKNYFDLNKASQDFCDKICSLVNLQKTSSKSNYSLDTNTNQLYHEIEQYKKKLFTQTQINQKLKIIIESQERSINNYKNEQFYKIEKDKLEVRQLISPRLYSGKSTQSNFTENNFFTQPINVSTRVATAKTNFQQKYRETSASHMNKSRPLTSKERFLK